MDEEQNKKSNNAEQPSIEDQQKTSTPDTKARKRVAYSVTPFTYEEGLLNGVLKIDKEVYQQFIESTERKKFTSVKLEKVREEIRKKEDEIREIREKNESLMEQVIRSAKQILSLEQAIQHLTAKKREWQEQSQKAEQERKEINPYYNWLVAAIFIIAGVAFIIAEIYISKQVLYDALDMNPSEAWTLAIAIALTAFIVKPAVDRIFEEPFLSGKNKVRSFVLLGTVAVMSLVALGSFGYYRNESALLRQNLELYEGQKRSLNDQIAFSAPSTNIETLKVELASLDDLIIETKNRLYTAPAIKLSFTLTSILFALAGAICFSIGLPVIKFTAKKRKLRKKIEGYKLNLERDDVIIQETERKIQTAAADKELAEFKHRELPSLEVLETSIAQLKEEEKEIFEQFLEHQVATEVSWYQEAYLRGERIEMTNDLYLSPYQIFKWLRLPYQNHTPKGPGGGNRSSRNDQDDFQAFDSSGEEINGEYLHERLRNLLKYNFQNKPKQNGKH
jgi:hypothetical protein